MEKLWVEKLAFLSTDLLVWAFCEEKSNKVAWLAIPVPYLEYFQESWEQLNTSQEQ